jgi:hypothetical protein
MPVTNPNVEHLLDQSVTLLGRPSGGRHRQANLRRAVSTAYYAVFHTILASFADRLVGRARRTTSPYVLAYRSVDHRAVGGLCGVAVRPAPPPKYVGFLPSVGFAPAIKAFAGIVLELQQERYRADYDPSWSIKSSEARSLVSAARDAITQWVVAPAEQRDAFLLLLAFPPR